MSGVKGIIYDNSYNALAGNVGHVDWVDIEVDSSILVHIWVTIIKLNESSDKVREADPPVATYHGYSDR